MSVKATSELSADFQAEQPAGENGADSATTDSAISKLAEKLMSELREKLGEWIEAGHKSQEVPDDKERRDYALSFMARWLDVLAKDRLEAGLEMLDEHAELAIKDAVMGNLFGAGLWEKYLTAHDLSDIHINGCDMVWLVDSRGNKRRAEPVAKTNEELIQQIRWAGSQLGRTSRRFDSSSPILNMRLPGGARLHAIMDVCAVPMVTIRFHNLELARLSQLFTEGMFDRAIFSFLQAAVKARFNMVICGGMGVGKTTLCRALLNEAPQSERIITVEDELELGLENYADQHPDMGALEARPPNIEGVGGVTLETLLRECLRMDADRIVVGEVRGPEVLGMLLAMTSGQKGSICTIHANSTKEAFERLAMYSSMTVQQYSQAFTYRLVGSAVDFVIHLDHIAGRRRITSIREVTGANEGFVQSNEIWMPGKDGRATISGEPFRVEPTLRLLNRHGFDYQLFQKNSDLWEK